jgi:hypothetical protein
LTLLVIELNVNGNPHNVFPGPNKAALMLHYLQRGPLVPIQKLILNRNLRKTFNKALNNPLEFGKFISPKTKNKPRGLQRARNPRATSKYI